MKKAEQAADELRGQICGVLGMTIGARFDFTPTWSGWVRDIGSVSFIPKTDGTASVHVYARCSPMTARGTPHKTTLATFYTCTELPAAGS